MTFVNPAPFWLGLGVLGLGVLALCVFVDAHAYRRGVADGRRQASRERVKS